MLLLIDNYDSFSWNLVHYLEELDQRVKVFRNDAITPSQALSGEYQSIVISPGPCTPNESGICLELIAANAKLAKPIPMLGVCLGHQALGQAFGGKVVRAPRPAHGKVANIRHFSHALFADISNPFEATRYHSLIVEDLPPELESIACLDEPKQKNPQAKTPKSSSSKPKMIMALAHKTLPFYGVQFHPESIATASGHTVLNNFLSLASNV